MRPPEPLLSGTVAGSATPAAMPSGASAAITVTLPAGTTSATHAVYAVASTSGDTANAAVTVDNTAPAAPGVSGGPANPTNATTASFTLTDADPTATFTCTLDGGAAAACTSPRAYSGLADGTHTFSVTATDPAGNTSPATTYTWTVDTVVPTGVITFPVSGSSYNATSYNAGCSTAGVGDLCGTAADAGSGVSTVRVSVQSGAGNYWNGATFANATETGTSLLTPTGSTAWNYALATSALTNGVTYTVRLHVTDAAGNASTTVSSTFTYDTTAPTATNVQTANVNQGIAGKPESGDSITYTFSESMRPASILAG